MYITERRRRGRNYKLYIFLISINIWATSICIFFFPYENISETIGAKNSGKIWKNALILDLIKFVLDFDPISTWF